MTAAGPPPAQPPTVYPPPSTMANTVPPRGPGVQPPFAAPPTDRPRTRTWIALVLSLVLALGACIGGIATLIATGNAAPAQISDKAEELVGKFLGYVHDDKFSDAHKLLCADTAKRFSVEQLRQEYGGITEFKVGQAVNYRGGDPITVDVPATEQIDGRSVNRLYDVESEDLGLRICGVS